MRELTSKGTEARSDRTSPNRPLIFLSNSVFSAILDKVIYRMWNGSFSTKTKIKKKILFVSQQKGGGAKIRSQMYVKFLCLPGTRKTTNLGTESLYNPGSISPEALSRAQI